MKTKLFPAALAALLFLTQPVTAALLTSTISIGQRGYQQVASMY